MKLPLYLIAAALWLQALTGLYWLLPWPYEETIIEETIEEDPEPVMYYLGSKNDILQRAYRSVEPPSVETGSRSHYRTL